MTAATAFGQYPPHVVDQRELYEDYGHLDMPRAPEAYRADPESVQTFAYP